MSPDKLTGKRVGGWRVLAVVPRPKGRKEPGRWYRVKCVHCGDEYVRSRSSVVTNRGGGCNACVLRKRTEHGYTNKANPLLRKVWAAVVAFRLRCDNRKDRAYKWYGARGITYDPAWRGDTGRAVREIVAHIGLPFRGAVLDRTDNDGDYVVDNLRWTTRWESARNTRGNRVFTYAGKTLVLSEWIEILGLPAARVSTWLGGMKHPSILALLDVIDQKRKQFQQALQELPSRVQVRHRMKKYASRERPPTRKTAKVRPPTKYAGKPRPNIRSLSPDQVKELKRLYATDDWTQKALGIRFHIAQATVGRLLRNEVLYATDFRRSSSKRRFRATVTGETGEN